MTTETQVPAILDLTKRKQVSEYERTIATLTSAAGTRTYILDAAPEGISGCYDWRNDRIILYPAIAALDTVTIALEEAGHSMEGAVYRKYAEETKLYCARAARFPGARGLLDWLEDWRIFTLLAKKFPGAAAKFQAHWELRRRYFTQVMQTDTATPVDALFLEIAERCCMNSKKAPKTYAAVLRAANRLLDRLAQPQTQPQPQPQPPQENGGDQGDSGGEGDEGDSGDSGDEGETGDSDDDQPGNEGEGREEDETGADDSTSGDEEGDGGNSEDGGDEEGETGEGDPEGEETDESGRGDSGGEDGREDGPEDQKGTEGAGPGSDQGPASSASQPPQPPQQTGHGRIKGGQEGEAAPVDPALVNYIMGVVLLSSAEVTTRLAQSEDWIINYQRVQFVPEAMVRRQWRQVDSALFEPLEGRG